MSKRKRVHRPKKQQRQEGLSPPMRQTTSPPLPLERLPEHETARSHYADARQMANFRAITRALRQHGQISLIHGADGARTAGRSVELGKATPEDINLFVQEAVVQGAIRRYAVQIGSLLPNQQLIELSEPELTAVIEDWINHTGVGVDCSGLVLQAAIGARDDIRAALAATGTESAQLPPAINSRERNAASFRREPQITNPADLRPGDVWVMSNGGHVRIISEVGTVPLPDGNEVIEFKTAESSGGSTQSAPGPVARTWRTRSLTTFHPITRINSQRAAIGGSFHRLP